MSGSDNHSWSSASFLTKDARGLYVGDVLQSTDMTVENVQFQIRALCNEEIRKIDDRKTYWLAIRDKLLAQSEDYIDVINNTKDALLEYFGA